MCDPYVTGKHNLPKICSGDVWRRRATMTALIRRSRDTISKQSGVTIASPATPMGRLWLHKKRLVAGLAKGKTNNKLVRDIACGDDLSMNARLSATIV